MNARPDRIETSPRAFLVRTATILAASLFGAASPALAQYTFSIGHRGPTNTVPDSLTGSCITAGDILGPPFPGGIPVYGPPFLPPPAMVIPGGLFPFAGLAIGTAGPCTCMPPPAMCPIELDALSYGMDFDPSVALPGLAGRWVFSVDEFAFGVPGAILTPNVSSEGPVGGIIEAAADVFEALGVGPGPYPPPAGVGTGNTALIDGNGFVSPSGARQPGVGLIEPLPPIAGPVAPGDDVDAIDLDTPPGTFPVYFSLDAAFFDPLRAIPNLGTAPANGFPGAAVLMTPAPGIAPVMYAPPAALGLDLFGPGTDDLDALSLTENGVPGFQLGPGGDVLYFSVRRGSAIIGIPDSRYGVPIEPGDILGLPIPPAATPSIFVAAEWLGLLTTRTNGVPFGDDLDALDCRAIPETGVPFCIGDGFANACPCGNTGLPPNGCANSFNAAGANLSAAGSASLAFDTVSLTSSGMPFTAFCILAQSPTRVAAVPFGDGLRCFGGPFIRMFTAMAMGGVVTFPTFGTISGRSAAAGAPIPVFAVRYYETYYRNPPPFACGPPAFFNSTNAVAVQWMP